MLRQYVAYNFPTELRPLPRATKAPPECESTGVQGAERISAHVTGETPQIVRAVQLIELDENLNRPELIRDGAEIMPMHQRIDDAHWSLGMALAWITHRSEQPVINIKAAKWAPTKAAIRDLLSALRSGRLIAHGTFVGEGIPRPLETAVWSTFKIIIKRMMFAGHMHVPTSGGSIVVAQRTGFPQARILSATVSAAKVRTLWPMAKQTSAAATRCLEYLVVEMHRSPDRAPKPKPQFLADCQARFPGLSERGFDRAWADAIAQTAAVGWSKVGRRGKSKH